MFKSFLPKEVFSPLLYASAKSLKAVALKYPKNAAAPFICASGKGEVAKNILDIAQKNNIPIVENSDLTDVLTLQEIGTIIPEETWELIANIFSYIIEQDSVL